MSRSKGHRWFAACWSKQTGLESSRIKRLRQEIAGGASGRVLEIGCGTGANFEHYPSDAHVIATEPDPFMLGYAKKNAAGAGNVTLCRSRAEGLPFRDGTFDTVVSTSNFCTIDEPVAALAEIRRVLRAGGEYRFMDHVRYKNAFGAFWQDALAPVWGWCGGGCQPNRDVARMIGEAGLEICDMEGLHVVPPVPPLIIVRPVIKGVARRLPEVVS
jgi:ubiquinone/menaquinone biosynthesis C-methylase UbiE